MLQIHRIKCGNGNCYIIKQNENAILIDTGKVEFLKNIEDEIDKYPIKLVLLTHAHFDHCENAKYFAKRFKVPIAMNKADLNLIQDQMQEQLYANTLLGKIVLKASVSSFKKVSMEFEPTVFLEDGDSLSEYGIDAKILALPGHTKGSIGIDCGKEGILVGDALMNLFYPTTSMLYENKEMMKQSAKKIGMLGDKLVYFGHGKPARNRIWVKD